MNQLGRYRNELNARVACSLMFAAADTASAIRELTLHWTTERRDAFVVAMLADTYGSFATPPAYFEGRAHVFGLRKDNLDKVHLYHIGAHGAGTSGLQGLEYDDVKNAIDYSNTMWQPDLATRMSIASYSIVDNDAKWRECRLYGDFDHVKAEHVPWSVIASFGVRGAAAKPAELSELGRGLNDTGTYPAVAFCGDCGLSFRAGQCVYCGRRAVAAWDFDGVMALPPAAWRAFLATGHEFKLDQRLAYMFEYQTWIRKTQELLPAAVVETCTRNKRIVMLGGPDASANA